MQAIRFFLVFVVTVFLAYSAPSAAALNEAGAGQAKFVILKIAEPEKLFVINQDGAAALAGALGAHATGEADCAVSGAV
jgi:hypothetical protein